jgi:hypothetical protein
MPATPPRPVVRLVVYTAVLFAGFYHNLYGIRSGAYWAVPDVRAGYQGYDAAPVLWRLGAAAAGSVPPLHPLVLVDPAGHPYPYVSQFGLPGVVGGAVVRLGGADPWAVAGWAAAAAGLAAAGAFGLVYAVAARRYGPLAGDLPTGLTALAPILVAVGPSSYWVAGAMLAPFAVAWAAYPHATTPRRRAGLYAAVAAAAAVKCLCGYEFVSAVVLAPVAAVWPAQHAAGLPWRRRAGEAAGLVAAGVGGFAVAVAAHAAQLEWVVGKPAAGAILDRATARTVSGSGRTEADHPPAFPAVYRVLPDRVAYPADCFLAYFDQPAAALPVWVAGPRGRVPLGWVVLAAAGAGAVLAARRGPAELVGLAGAAGLGLAAAASWQVLAVNHMCVHRHLNLVVYFVPFLPLAYVLAGAAAGRLAPRPRAVTAVGLALLAAAVAGNVRADRARAARDAAGQVAAERAVGAWLAAPGPPAAGVHGRVDVCRAEAAAHYILRVEHGRGEALARPAEPTVFVAGWAADGPNLRGRPSARVVVVADGRVVPLAVARYSRDDIDTHFGRPLLATGFAAFVPAGRVPPGGAVRVFAVAAADPARVAELPGP